MGEVPAGYVAGSPGGEVDDAWIARFNDKALSKLVDAVEKDNPDIRIAAVRVEKAATNAYLAGAAARPYLDANFAATRRKQNFIGFPVGGGGGDGAAGSVDGGSGGGSSGVPSGSLFNTFGPSLDVRWEVDLWGRVRAGVSASLAELEAEVANEKALRCSLAAQTAKAYFALKEAEEQVVIAVETRDSFDKTVVTFVDAALERGEQPVFQARLAKTEAATAEANLREREQIRDDAARKLDLLLGRYPKGELSAGAKLPDLPGKPPAGLPSSLLRRRPDLVAAERRVAAADMRIKEANLAVLPQLSLTSSVGTSSEELKNVFDRDFSIYSMGMNVIQPILRGGEIRGNQKLRRLEVEESLANFEKVALVAFQEVENALDAEGHLGGRWKSTKEALELSKEAYDRARDDYAEGNLDALTLLTAQRQWLTLRAREVSLRGLRLANRVDLHLALGGDYKVRNR